MKRWGYSDADIKTVVAVILNDGIVSDIARRRVRDERKNIGPEVFREKIGNPSAIRILRAVNRADVIGVVGNSGFAAIANAYSDYFDKAME
jgi:hypothetical protein